MRQLSIEQVRHLFDYNPETGFLGRSNYWKHQNKPWTATIRVNGKRHHVGRYKTPAEAHVAYLMAAKKLFGEFARAG